MHYIAAVESDIGSRKTTNQDSALIKHADTSLGEVLMAVVCDGMGGLSKGEVASGSVIRCFADWFDAVLPERLRRFDAGQIRDEWVAMLRNCNRVIREYGQRLQLPNGLGTTFTGVLFVGDQLIAAHVGDSRLYYIQPGESIMQLTEDQTFIQREISAGRMTPQQAAVDRRRNMLLQCVGESREIRPQTILHETLPGAYLLCSDGFRHEITSEEILESLSEDALLDSDSMSRRLRRMIETVMTRGERDNITGLLVRAL